MQSVFDALPLGAYFKRNGDSVYYWKESETHAFIFRNYVGSVATFEPSGTPDNTRVPFNSEDEVTQCAEPPRWMTVGLS